MVGVLVIRIHEITTLHDSHAEELALQNKDGRGVEHAIRMKRFYVMDLLQHSVTPTAS